MYSFSWLSRRSTFLVHGLPSITHYIPFPLPPCYFPMCVGLFYIHHRVQQTYQSTEWCRHLQHQLPSTGPPRIVARNLNARVLVLLRSLIRVWFWYVFSWSWSPRHELFQILSAKDQTFPTSSINPMYPFSSHVLIPATTSHLLLIIPPDQPVYPSILALRPIVLASHPIYSF
jgi:hypothetical protein